VLLVSLERGVLQLLEPLLAEHVQSVGHGAACPAAAEIGARLLWPPPIGLSVQPWSSH
jgi:hypothetical protein